MMPNIFPSCHTPLLPFPASSVCSSYQYSKAALRWQTLRLFAKTSGYQKAISDQQKDSLIEKLEKAGVEYVIRENEGIVNNSSSYIVIIQAKDRAKIA